MGLRSTLCILGRSALVFLISVLGFSRLFLILFCTVLVDNRAGDSYLCLGWGPVRKGIQPMAAPYRGAMDPTEAELQERRVMLATGVSPAAVAVRFGRSVGTIYNQASHEKDLIAALKEELLGVVHAKTAGRWINDVVQSTEVLEALAEDTIERRAEPDLPARDVSRYNRDARQLIRDAHELHGLIKSRVQAEVRSVELVEEVIGFDDLITRGSFASRERSPVSGPDPEPVPEPEPEPVKPGTTPEASTRGEASPRSGPVPAEFAGRGTTPSSPPSPSRDPQYEPPKPDSRAPRVGFL